MEPLLYVISINYNSSEHTLEMINSLLKSNYKNYKIVIVDNNSSQEEKEKLDILNDKIIYIQSDVNLGFSGGNNLGIKRAIVDKAKYVMILNNDTTVDANLLSVVVESLENKEGDVVCPKIVNFYDPSIIDYAGGEIVKYKGGVRIYGHGVKDSKNYDANKYISFAHGCCTAMETSLFEELGLMDERYFLYFEDTDLSAKIIKKGKKILYIPSAKVYHKESVSTIKYSDNYQYYFCRNRLLFIKSNITSFMKYVAYMYTSFYILKHLLNRNFRLKNVVTAVKDFSVGSFGKREI